MSFLRDPIWQFVSVVIALVAIVITLVQQDVAWLVVGFAVAFVIALVIATSRSEKPNAQSPTENVSTIYQQQLNGKPLPGRRVDDKSKWLWSLCILFGALGGLIANTMNPDVRVTLIGTIVGTLIAFFIYSFITTSNW